MTISLLELFRIGPGPSSSHTVGPMRAAARFRSHCLARGITPARLQVELQGSLSATGHGHGTDRAVLAGLCGDEPETCDVDALQRLPDTLRDDPHIDWGGVTVRLHPDDVVFRSLREVPTASLAHPNTLVLRAFDAAGSLQHEESVCSVGGGFVLSAELIGQPVVRDREPKIPFHNGDSLLAASHRTGLSIGEIVLQNDREWHPDLDEQLDRIVAAFRDCVARGLRTRGELPGGLGVVRRAGALLRRLDAGQVEGSWSPIARAQAYAYAINEENAAGGRVVTAPTNGAAGIFPAVLLEAADRLQLDRARIHRAIGTGAAIAMVIKTHASLSGAEVGCQGEVGSATAMAAAALCEILGGTPDQVENAAEIGLEHNLGLTCDPIRGLVQAPCIERNAMGVAKAWSAAQLSLHAEGRGVVSLDRVIRVMRRTGHDMHTDYKETSTGGLAVSLPEC
ncbi:MAG: L-serine ammonia-lyase [Planctomycetes bacterium]|nr:L-serine ammonia-lyase [Planctomycetota bacterium]